VFDVALEELAEMQIGTGGVSRIGTLESKAIASESVVWFLSDELFEQLAARFLLFSHGSVRIIAGVENAPKFDKRGSMAKKIVSAEGETLRGKLVSASRSEMAEVVLPAVTNLLGKLLGGHVMHLVDVVAAMAASRHSNSYVVTASVDYIDFRNA